MWPAQPYRIEADADQLEALNAELDAIEERKKALKIEVEERKKAAEAVAAGAGKEVRKGKEVETMTNKEIRNTPQYIEAFAKYIKTGNITQNITSINCLNLSVTVNVTL